MSAYCDIAPGHPFHGPYHDTEYGFPLEDDRGLFERLCMEIMQAGLSWLLILKKREAMRLAFADYDLHKVAAFDEADITRLLADAGIIRNRLKILAIIENAKRILAIQAQYGSFAKWLAAHPPENLDQATKLFRATFKFTGREVVNEFLMSIGYLAGAHRADCPVHARILAQKPYHVRKA